MTAAVELLFDERLETRVRSLWRRLAALGLSTPDGWPGPHRRPHISLAVCDDLDVTHGPELTGAIRPVHNAPVHMESTGWFAGGVLYLTPAWSPELASVHAAVWQMLGSWTTSPWPEYAPGRWVAHCTLATRVDPALLGPALTTITEYSPLVGTVRGVGVGVDGTLVWQSSPEPGGPT